MGSLRCYRETWADPTANTTSIDFLNDALGFMAITSAFDEVFKGEALFGTRPTQNSTFFLATARCENNQEFTAGGLVMPTSLMPHLQRVLWHIPINVRERSLGDTCGGDSFLPQSNRTRSTGIVGFEVDDEQIVLVQRFDFARVGVTLGVALVVGVGAVIWVSLSSIRRERRLIHDSLTHSFTISGKGGPAIPEATTDGLGTLLRERGSVRLRYTGGQIHEQSYK